MPGSKIIGASKFQRGTRKKTRRGREQGALIELLDLFNPTTRNIRCIITERVESKCSKITISVSQTCPQQVDVN